MFSSKKEKETKRNETNRGWSVTEQRGRECAWLVKKKNTKTNLQVQPVGKVKAEGSSHLERFTGPTRECSLRLGVRPGGTAL